MTVIRVLTGHLDSNKLSCGKGEISIEYVSFPQAPGTGGNSPVSALNLVTIEVPDACRCVVIGWVSLQIKATSPIVLVPGMLTGPSFWTLDPITIDDHLRAERFVVVDTIDHQAESITDAASNLMKEVEKAALRNGVDSVHLVAHSKGGLDSIRMLAKEIKSSDPFDILSLTTLDSPLRGSVLADMVHARQQALIAALFVVINVMEHALVLDLIGVGLAKMISLNEIIGYGAGTGAMLVSAAAFSSVTDNIPLAAMLAKILQAQDIASTDPLWWSVVFGANLGGNLTPIGSASTLVAVTIMHKNGVAMSFVRFVKLAIPFAALQIALATVYVLMVLR